MLLLHRHVADERLDVFVFVDLAVDAVDAVDAAAQGMLEQTWVS